MDSGRGVPDGTEDDCNKSTASTNTTTTATNTGGNSGKAPQQQVTGAWLAWKPNETLLLNLMAMDISPVTAKKALYYTKNESIEAAIEWIFGNQDADLETPLEIELQRDPKLAEAFLSGTALSDEEDDLDDELYKMVFVVNAELSMGVGKIAAQVAHAALGLHRILLQHQAKHGEHLLSWAEYGETKIVLKGETTEHLINLEHAAIDNDLPCYLVHDAGKTQVKSGSTTVLSIFGSNKKVDKVTGSLKLY